MTIWGVGAMRRTLACGVAALVGLASLAACGGGSAGSDSARPAAGTATTVAERAGGRGTDGGDRGGSVPGDPVGSAGSGAGGSGERLASATTAAAPTATTPPYSFDGSVPPPELVNTGTDYVAIFKSLAAYRTWLLRHDPDPGLVEHAYVPGTEAFDALSDDLSLLRNGRQRYIEDGQRFEVEVASDKSGVVSLRVREHIRANRIIDAQGQTVDEAPSGPVNDYIVLLAADPEGKWRVADVTRALGDAVVQL